MNQGLKTQLMSGMLKNKGKLKPKKGAADSVVPFFDC